VTEPGRRFGDGLLSLVVVELERVELGVEVGEERELAAPAPTAYLAAAVRPT